jgi:hypothetical protein
VVAAIRTWQGPSAKVRKDGTGDKQPSKWLADRDRARRYLKSKTPAEIIPLHAVACEPKAQFGLLQCPSPAAAAAAQYAVIGQSIAARNSLGRLEAREATALAESM